MIQEFYGLEIDAFSLSPDLDFLFLSNAHEEAVAHLLYGLEQNEDIILIVGDIGTGKTLALHRLVTQVSPSFIPVSINVTTMDFEQLLRLILLKLDVEPNAGASLAALLDSFEKELIRRRDQGRKVLLVIDEAQNLGVDVLESVRLLMNLAQPGKQVLQLVLVGQLGLRTTIDLPEMRQLRQRIRVDYQFGFLNRQETEEYVLHRLKTAGREKELFDRGALDRIHQLSCGVPRVVNILASKALLAGYVEEARKIGSRHFDDIPLDDILGDPRERTRAAQGGRSAVVGPAPESDRIAVGAGEPAGQDTEPPSDTAPADEFEDPTRWSREPETPARPGPRRDPADVPPPPSARTARPGNVQVPAARRSGRSRRLSVGLAIVALAVVGVVSYPRWSHLVPRPGAVESMPEQVLVQPTGGRPSAGREASGGRTPSTAVPVAEGASDTAGEPAGEDGVAAEAQEAPAVVVADGPKQGSDAGEAEAEPEGTAAPQRTGTASSVQEVVLPGDIPQDQFLLHVASFVVPERGVNFTSLMRRQGLNAFMKPAINDRGEKWYRIYIGPFRTRGDAVAAADEYKGLNLVKFARITTPDPNWSRP